MQKYTLLILTALSGRLAIASSPNSQPTTPPSEGRDREAIYQANAERMRQNRRAGRTHPGLQGRSVARVLNFDQTNEAIYQANAERMRQNRRAERLQARDSHAFAAQQVRSVLFPAPADMDQVVPRTQSDPETDFEI